MKVPTSPHATKTKIVEEALRRWLEERVQRDLERQTEEYYRALSPAEQEEDKQRAFCGNY